MRNEYIEFNPKGFIRNTRRWLCFWKREHIEWQDVQNIRAIMWDCFSCHSFGFRLTLHDMNSVCVTDINDSWDDFRMNLYEAFPDINQDSVEEVEGYSNINPQGQVRCQQAVTSL